MLSNGCLLDSMQKALHCRQRNLKLGMIPSQQLKLNNPYLSVSACVCLYSLCDCGAAYTKSAASPAGLQHDACRVAKAICSI